MVSLSTNSHVYQNASRVHNIRYCVTHFTCVQSFFCPSNTFTGVHCPKAQKFVECDLTRIFTFTRQQSPHLVLIQAHMVSHVYMHPSNTELTMLLWQCSRPRYFCYSIQRPTSRKKNSIHGPISTKKQKMEKLVSEYWMCQCCGRKVRCTLGMPIIWLLQMRSCIQAPPSKYTVIIGILNVTFNTFDALLSLLISSHYLNFQLGSTHQLLWRRLWSITSWNFDQLKGVFFWRQYGLLVEGQGRIQDLK